ncbi:inorganic phosphate transporter [Frigidibacter albus]|uniref:Phosphate transporter n=1 Tax=Frigidibacter albus TaxID=1465486 RepID=A0A6L8VJ58_9RHOB|nr:inorganic phosphate transporter [Frigidibacter albus]MZQ90253.1 inorganic phosphate transporter [Frigidibacter albus]NBE32249.1 inorganic phosphate transporter [Frigidibacter albus]GGH58372.1 phosphate transporter [Frigidibacter albus]
MTRWKALDKDLDRIGALEEGALFVSRPLVAPGLALVFIVLATLVAAVVTGAAPSGLVIVAAAAVGAYMALNIGANDVANNMGPAVGAKALSMGWALAIAAVFETLGAVLAGGEVVATISGGIVAPGAVADPQVFVWLMMAALVAAAVWINLATLLGAPVSTTHSVVGGVAGAGVAAAGVAAVNWPQLGAIAASWMISPLLAGLLAALILAFIKARIMDAEDVLAAARRWVPALIGVMAGTFGTYLAMQALSHVWVVNPRAALAFGMGAGLAGWAGAGPLVRRQAAGLENRRRSLRRLFALPLILSAALLSFAHGANDVANVVGPLAAIVKTASSGDVAAAVQIPVWVMGIGALGISVGLILFGPKLIRLVGSEITRLNEVRAYCVALAAAVTVIVASWLGLPVSTTHTAVGAVFGVGFYREWDNARQGRSPATAGAIPPEERRRRKLVRRSHVVTVVAAWVVTVPAAGALAAMVFLLLRGLAG